jgi:hypothetical protein
MEAVGYEKADNHGGADQEWGDRFQSFDQWGSARQVSYPCSLSRAERTFDILDLIINVNLSTTTKLLFLPVLTRLFPSILGSL